jgi:hypothetical protein
VPAFNPDVCAPGESLQALHGRLVQAYRWGDIGLAAAYAGLRQTPAGHLVTAEVVAVIGADLFSRLRQDAREVVAAFRHGHALRAVLPADDEASAERDDYLRNIMRRLMYSALFGEERLFVDALDLELCEQQTLLAMYRLALFEGSGEEHPLPVQASVH